MWTNFGALSLRLDKLSPLVYQHVNEKLYAGLLNCHFRDSFDVPTLIIKKKKKNVISGFVHLSSWVVQ